MSEDSFVPYSGNEIADRIVNDFVGRYGGDLTRLATDIAAQVAGIQLAAREADRKSELFCKEMLLRCASGIHTENALNKFRVDLVKLRDASDNNRAQNTSVLDNKYYHGKADGFQQAIEVLNELLRRGKDGEYFASAAFQNRLPLRVRHDDDHRRDLYRLDPHERRALRTVHLQGIGVRIMPTYGIEIQITGKGYVEVEAETEEAAIAKALDEMTIEDIDEWTPQENPEVELLGGEEK